MNQSEKGRKQTNISGDRNIDVIVLGVGTCGEDLSLRLLDAGLNLVGIEAELVGGECAYWACLPTKAMIRAANVLQEARRIEGMAGNAQVTPSWETVAARVREEVTGNWNDSVAVKRYEERGGHLIHGRGKINGPRTVTVDDESFTARLGIVIATGSKPFIPPIPGLSEVDYWTTHDVIQAESLPKSLTILGGGAVGCEIGQVLARFGVDVTIVEASDRLLPSEEPEASQVIEAAFTGEGIKVVTGAAVQQVDRRDELIVVSLADGQTVENEQILIATGRRADLSHLGLETIGLDATEKSITVDDHMRVMDGVWAMGDVTGKAIFTHVALYQSAIIAAEILGEDHIPARYDAVPRGVFTDPELGAVGMTEAEARAAGIEITVVSKRIPATFRGWLHASSDGVVKLIFDRNTGYLIGATAVGPCGGELLGMLTLAVHSKIPLSDLRSMIYAFPTFYGGIGEAIGAYARGLTTVLDPSYEGVQILDSVETAPRG